MPVPSGKVTTPSESSVAPPPSSWLLRWSSNCWDTSHRSTGAVAVVSPLPSSAAAGAARTPASPTGSVPRQQTTRPASILRTAQRTVRVSRSVDRA